MNASKDNSSSSVSETPPAYALGPREIPGQSLVSRAASLCHVHDFILWFHTDEPLSLEQPTRTALGPCAIPSFNAQEELMPAAIPQQYLDLFQKRAFAH